MIRAYDGTDGAFYLSQMVSSLRGPLSPLILSTGVPREGADVRGRDVQLTQKLKIFLTRLFAFPRDVFQLLESHPDVVRHKQSAMMMSEDCSSLKRFTGAN